MYYVPVFYFSFKIRGHNTNFSLKINVPVLYIHKKLVLCPRIFPYFKVEQELSKLISYTNMMYNSIHILKAAPEEQSVYFFKELDCVVWNAW